MKRDFKHQPKKQKFSDRVLKQLNPNTRARQKKSIGFACSNCLDMFDFEYEDMCFDQSEDLRFTPGPSCPRCGSTDEIVFSDHGQEMVEDMMFHRQIKTCK